MQLIDLTDEQKIFECVAGSRAYGTNTPESDEDLRGIFVLPPEAHLSLTAAPKQVSDERSDITFYELRRFLELAAECNPNIIELMWTPSDCVRIQRPAMTHLLAHRDLFITKQAYDAFSGYAYAQIKRAKGQNKWVNNPQPELPPSKQDYCWYVAPDFPGRDDGATTARKSGPWRPIPLSEADLKLSVCHAAKMEHAAHTYRLYQYTDSAPKGVFRGESENLVVESIPLEDEWTRFVGLLIFNEPGFAGAMRNWKNYWDWRARRNESRYRSQEMGEIDYDAKNVMHCLRLLWSGASILETGAPLVRFSGERLKTLMDIRLGRLQYDAVMDIVESQKAKLDILKAQSTLPEVADRARIDDLYHEILAMRDLS